MKNYLAKNWRTTAGAGLAVIGLGLHWSGIIDREQYEYGMAIVVIYIGIVAKDK